MRPLGVAISQASGSTEVDPDGKYPIAGIYSFGRGLIKRPDIQGFETAYQRLTPLKAGQLVMSKLNAWEGAIALVSSEFDGSHVSPEYPVFNINELEADARYVGYLVTWPELWERLTPRGSMVRRKRTAPQALMDLEVPLPDLDEQCRIADRLDVAFVNLRRVDILRDHMRRTSAAAFESLLVSVSGDNTPRVSIAEVLRAERTSIEVDPDSPYRALGLRSFGKGTIRYAPAPGAELSKLRYFTFLEDALVLSNIKAWEGAISVTVAEDLECVASNRFLFYLPRDSRVNIGFVRYYLLTRAGLIDVGACSPGMADRNRTLGVKAFERLRIPLPERAVQDHVVQVLDGVMDSLAKTTAADECAAALRTSLLNAAFSGQI